MGFRLLFLLIVAQLLVSCASLKKKTQAEICADCESMFPPRKEVRVDTFWDVRNFPVEEFVYILEDTVDCFVFIDEKPVVGKAEIKKEITVPSRPRIDSVPVITKIINTVDSATVARNRELEFTVIQMEKSLKDCRKNGGKLNKWLIWAVVILSLSLLASLLKK